MFLFNSMIFDYNWISREILGIRDTLHLNQYVPGKIIFYDLIIEQY